MLFKNIITLLFFLFLGTGNDRIYGICDMGKLYVVDYAQRMKFTE